MKTESTSPLRPDWQAVDLARLNGPRVGLTGFIVSAAYGAQKVCKLNDPFSQKKVAEVVAPRFDAATQQAAITTSSSVDFTPLSLTARQVLKRADERLGDLRSRIARAHTEFCTDPKSSKEQVVACAALDNAHYDAIEAQYLIQRAKNGF